MNPKKHILVTEDEQSIADTILIALEDEGFHGSWVRTGSDCLERLSGEPFDLLILDLGLPDGSGFEVLRKIRSDASNSKLPVIILSARSSEADRVAGLETGADDYMVKPFSPRELAARVRAVLRRFDGSGQSEENAQKWFSVDEQKKVIYFQGQSLSLSPYEYGTLALLLERPGIVYSRQTIMDRVWEEPEDSFDRAVDTVIKNIRSKLRKINGEEDPLETRRSMGYLIREKYK